MDPQIPSSSCLSGGLSAAAAPGLPGGASLTGQLRPEPRGSGLLPASGIPVPGCCDYECRHASKPGFESYLVASASCLHTYRHQELTTAQGDPFQGRKLFLVLS